jgi:peptidoglycan/xylan/chitin deacetylase (PgdA/CDA1 family)
MSAARREASVKRLSAWLLALTPHPAAMYQAIDEDLPRLEDFVSAQVIADCYAGMTAEQVGELGMDPLFAFGGHTVNHPFLTKCGRQDMVQEIQENREWIEQASQQSCNCIAYPAGDYDNNVIQCVRDLGMAQGYAVSPTMARQSHYAIPRIGIYDPSVHVLGFKACWATHMRGLSLGVG